MAVRVLLEFIDEDAAKASARGAVVVAWAREGEQDFAGEAGSQEHGGTVRHEPRLGWG
ncbi:hypothetical protein [Nocardia sp. SC052]|uniref:hypothetical protein n=1 Tax=Nocardia sichangensis TaxID=3385975 RepID=UPI00399F6857